jgi:putative hydrolase of the HAD superfamily
MSPPEIIAQKRAVIFDLFHTLTCLERTEPKPRLTYTILNVPREAWDAQLLLHSMPRLRGTKRDPLEFIREMARAIDPAIPDEVIGRATENRRAAFQSALRQISPTVGAVLGGLRQSGKRIGLVSNADVLEVAAWSECPIRDKFDAVVFSCEAGYVKPEAEIYHRCLRELGVTASETVFVGDGGSDELKAARELGMSTIMVAGIVREIWPQRIPARAVHADCVIEELPELLPNPNSITVQF